MWPREQKVKSTAISFNVYMFICFACLLLQLVWSQYFQIKNFGGLFAVGSDLPATVPNYRFKPIVGEHFFGDLLDGKVNFPKLPSGSYFGPSYLFFWLTSGVSYRIVFILFFNLALLLCAFSLRRWLSLVLEENKGMVYALHFSYPFLFAADRGQMNLLTGYLTAIGLSYLVTSTARTKDGSWGQAILGIAFSVKAYPVFTAIALEKFWSIKKWRSMFVSYFLFCCSTPLIFVLLGGSLSALNTKEQLYLKEDYFVRTLYQNTSLKALLFHLQRISIDQIAQIFEIMFLNYSMFYIFYALFFAILLKSRFLDIQEKLLAFAILSISVVPIAPVYSQTLVCAVALISLTNIKVGSKKRQKLIWFVVLISTVPVNIPIIIERNRGPETFYQSLVVPLVQHSYVVILGVIVLIGLFKSRRFKVVGDG